MYFFLLYIFTIRHYVQYYILLTTIYLGNYIIIGSSLPKPASDPNQGDMTSTSIFYLIFKYIKSHPQILG